MTTATTTGTTELGTLPLRTLVLLGALTAAAPLVTDVYLPALPDLARALGTTEAAAQLTVSVSIVGLAAGQLLAGPLSDRIGRLVPLRCGVLLLAVTSFLCATADGIATLLALRLAQGLAAAATLVVARAIIRDVYDGLRAAKIFSELILVMGLAPVVGPVLGGQLLRVTDWRGIFVALGLVAVVLLLASFAWVHETWRPRARGSSGGLGVLLRDRTFRGFLVLAGCLGVVLFGYISLSPFVLRQEYGVGSVAFSWIFGANALGMMVGGQVSARLVGRLGPARMLRAGLVLLASASALVALALATSAPLGLVLAPMWFVLCGLGLSFGNATALALVPHGDLAGSASALIGTSQFLFGAAVPPLLSLGGASGVAMGAGMVVAATLALVVGARVARPGV
jgi:DHA1 family bicyclomycin/chloramphenicol resistance-like MFS transporter